MIGSTFQINEARPYTENGVRGLHISTLLATITGGDGYAVEYEAEIVDEEGRPSFASERRDIRGTVLVDAVRRYVASGEWMILSTPGLA